MDKVMISSLSRLCLVKRVLRTSNAFIPIVLHQSVRKSPAEVEVRHCLSKKIEVMASSDTSTLSLGKLSFQIVWMTSGVKAEFAL